MRTPATMQTKPKLFFTFLLITFLGGVLAISYFAVTQRQEVRQKAATSEGAATLILSPSAREFSVGKTESIKVTAHAADSSIDAYQVVAKISGSIPPDLTFVPAENSGIQIVKSELTDSDTSGKLFTLAAVTKDPKHIAQRGSLIPIGEFRFTPQTTGSFSVSFDQTLTKVTKGKASDKNILNIPSDETFTVVEPSETATSALTPGATPGATCGNNLCETSEYVPCPAGTKCIWAGSCPSDCVAGNKCLNGATCNSGDTCPAICTMSFPPQCQAGICPGPGNSPTPTPTPKPAFTPTPTPQIPCLPLPPNCGSKLPNGSILFCDPPPGIRYCPTPTPSPKPVNTAPQIRNRSLPDGRVGTKYSAEVIATDPDPGDIVTITASGLPDRLRLTCNAGRRSILPNTQTTCRIEGEPTKRGTFDVRILARDSRGASTGRTFSLTIVRRKAPLPVLQPLFDRLPF